MQFYIHTTDAINSDYADVERVDAEVSFNGPYCNKCGRYLEESGKWEKPHKIKLFDTRRKKILIGDIMYGFPDVYSQNFVDWFKSCNFNSSVSFEEIDKVVIKPLSRSIGVNVPQLYTMNVPVSKVRIDWSRTVSDAVWDTSQNDMHCECWPEKPVDVLNTEGGLFLDLKEYNNEDIFEIYQPSLVFFSEHFIEEYLKSNMKGLTYKKIEDFNISYALDVPLDPLRDISTGIGFEKEE